MQLAEEPAPLRPLQRVRTASVFEKRILLANPRLSVPTIEAAAALPSSISALARLIEAGRLAASLRIPGEIVVMLKGTR